MNIYNIILAEIIRLNNEIQYLEEQISKLPPGHLLSSKGKNDFVYKQYINRNQIHYIPSSERGLAIELAEKSVYQKRLKDAVNERDALQSYLQRHKVSSLENLLQKDEGCRALIEETKMASLSENNHQLGTALLANREWREKVSKNPEAYKLLVEHSFQDKDGRGHWNYEGSKGAKFQENRDIKTMNGIWVRSKSEAFIFNELYRSGILFLFEPGIKNGNWMIYPDFYIFHPLKGTPWIHEHAGMMYEPSRAAEYSDKERMEAIKYTNDFANKTKDYLRNGWILNINYSVTSETKFQPFDTTLAVDLVNRLLE